MVVEIYDVQSYPSQETVFFLHCCAYCHPYSETCIEQVSADLGCNSFFPVVRCVFHPASDKGVGEYEQEVLEGGCV